MDVITNQPVVIDNGSGQIKVLVKIQFKSYILKC